MTTLILLRDDVVAALLVPLAAVNMLVEVK